MLMALGLILFHSTVLICQFMTFSVAINSKRSNALIALLIASNFVEIKGALLPSRSRSNKLGAVVMLMCISIQV